MERPTSNAVMIGVVLMALAAVIGLFWGVFTLSKTTINDGTTNVQEKIMQFEDLNWETYDDKEVLGREILSLHTTSTYDDIAILVHTVRMNDGVVISKDNDRYVQFYKGEPYVNYGAILGVLGTDRIEDMNEYLLEKGTAVRKSEDSLEQKAGAIYTDAVLCRDDLGYVTKDDNVTALNYMESDLYMSYVDSKKNELLDKFTNNGVIDNKGLYNWLNENGYIEMNYEEVSTQIFKQEPEKIIDELLLTSLEIPHMLRNKTVEQLAEFYDFKEDVEYSNLSTHKARSWYLWQESLLSEELKLETNRTQTETAMYAYAKRNDLRTKTREKMSNIKIKEYLQKTEKNLPYEKFVELKMNTYYEKEGIWLTDSQIELKIINSSSHSRALLNKYLGIEVK